MRVVPLLLLFASISSCNMIGGCEVELIESRRDIEGMLTAYHYVKNCGATAPYVTYVAIGEASGGPTGGTPVFIARDRPQLDIRWTAPHRLSIVHGWDTDVWKIVPRQERVVISVTMDDRRAATDHRDALSFPQPLP